MAKRKIIEGTGGKTTLPRCKAFCAVCLKPFVADEKVTPHEISLGPITLPIIHTCVPCGKTFHPEAFLAQRIARQLKQQHPEIFGGSN